MDGPLDGPALTERALEALEDAWRKQAAPIAQNLRPGVSPDQLSQAIEESGLTLPAEARLWWQWHNGAHNSADTGVVRVIGPGYEYLSLETAVAFYWQEIGIAREVAESNGTLPADIWDPSWFPIVKGRGLLAVDCTPTASTSTPVRVINWGTDATSAEPKATSLGSVVALWTQALEQGWWTWHAQRWHRHDELISRQHDLSRLV